MADMSAKERHSCETGAGIEVPSRSLSAPVQMTESGMAGLPPPRRGPSLTSPAGSLWR